jgi:hypothetical protein
MSTHGAVAGSMRKTIEGLREANAGFAQELETARRERDQARSKFVAFNERCGTLLERLQQIADVAVHEDNEAGQRMQKIALAALEEYWA